MDEIFTKPIEAFIASVRLKAQDGLTVREIVTIFGDFIALAVSLAQKLGNSSAEKKLLVMAAVGRLYDAIAPSVPLPMLLQPFRGFFRPYVKQLVLAIADGAIEWIYAKLKEEKLEPVV